MSSLTRISPGALARWLTVAIAAGLSLCATAAGAQGLPSFAPINPVATSRSGLYFQPYRTARPGGWAVGIGVDYASAIEYNELATAEYILDSELLRVNLTVAHDIDPKRFVLVDVSARGAYNGFLDGFLDWYHQLLGIRLRERERRPRDEFLYHVALDGSVPIERRSADIFLGDVRLGFGWRYSPAVQGMLSLTLPTATGPAGYGRGVVSASAVHTFRTPARARLVYEGSLGLGYTPSHGGLAPFQRETFVAATSGIRFRIWGRQSLYSNLFYHSPYYHDTALPALDRSELSFDFGWIAATCAGSEWRLGLTEDLTPSGPGIDLVFRFGVALRTGTAPCVGAGTPSRLDHVG